MGRRADERGSIAPIFGRLDAVRSGPVWRGLRPSVLKGAGVLVLAGVIMGAVSNQFASDEPSAEPQRALPALSAQQTLQARAAGPAPAPATASAPAATPAAFTTERILSPAAPAAVAALPQPALPPREAPAAPIPKAPPAALAAAPRTEAAAAASAATAFWPEEAVDCPRDWMAVDSPGNYGDGPVDCGGTAVLLQPDNILLGDQLALSSPASEPVDDEAAALQFAPAIPKIRPKPPARKQATRKTARKSTRKAKSGWPSEPPPNCGDKHAYYRYINKVPTWYCR